MPAHFLVTQQTMFAEEISLLLAIDLEPQSLTGEEQQAAGADLGANANPLPSLAKGLCHPLRLAANQRFSFRLGAPVGCTHLEPGIVRNHQVEVPTSRGPEQLVRNRAGIECHRPRVHDHGHAIVTPPHTSRGCTSNNARASTSHCCTQPVVGGCAKTLRAN